MKIKLIIAEKDWKKRTVKTVSGMVGIYLLKKVEGLMSLEHLVKEPLFLPNMEVCFEYQLDDIWKDGYYIMPATFESRKNGRFILSVNSDKDFILNPV